MAFSEAQIALRNRIWAQVHAKRAASPVAPRTRISAVQKMLGPAAQAHVNAGGCSGDLCPACNGKGWAYETYDHGKVTECACHYCNGKGLGK